MTTSPVQQIDLTAQGDSLTYTEILTPAGIVRVAVNMVDLRTGRRAVVVEVVPNTGHRRETAPGGHWDVKIREAGLGHWTEIVLTKRPESTEGENHAS